MKLAASVLTLIVMSAVLSFAEGSKIYVGVVTDGRMVKVAGVLYTKTGILKVERIDASN